MMIEFDVVIIGGSVTGRYAAAYAASLHAKVALLTDKDGYNKSNYGQIVKGVATAKSLTTWSEVKLYADGVASRLEQMNSLADLAALGVEVIIGEGEFLASSKLALAVNGRLLSGRTYLLANETIPKIPQITGLAATGYLTLANVWQSLNKVNLPQNWVIIGGTPESIEISQTLAKLGCNVTLILQSPLVLSRIEPEIARVLLAQLEVDGIQIFINTVVTQLQQVATKTLIQAGDRTIETDEILVVSGQRANLESLNLTAVGVKQKHHRLIVNDKLQTTNHRIYACGSIIGGYDLVNMANYEAKVALNNALFVPIFSVNYGHIPWVICSQPMLTQVGLTGGRDFSF
jgi:pyruvate/2-oxoglutarate dehydrogenase complex dihydrolipoamide dehydrogenase (E3) component